MSIGSALIILTSICLICVVITISCSRDSTGPDSPDQSAFVPKTTLTEIIEDAQRYRWGLLEGPIGQLTDLSGCGGYADTRYSDIPPTQEAVEWEYDGAGNLYLHRINAGFNCCTDIHGDITFADNMITVTDSEDGEFCYCLCLYDLNYEINGVRPDTYTINFIELHTGEGDAPLEFTIRLRPEPASGIFIVERSDYPWGYSGSAGGEVVAYSECGGWATDSYGDGLPADSNCFVWDYDGGTLNLTHQNATFNCCVDLLSAEFTFSNDTIYIVESEVLKDGGCCCICPYDVDMQITNLPAGVYTVVVESPWTYNDTEFSLDLTTEPGGYTCYKEAIEMPF